MSHLDEVHAILCDALGLRSLRLERDTALLGNLPELDSMAVASVITALEDHFGFEVRDDEISARHFATLGSLSDFVESKLS